MPTGYTAEVQSGKVTTLNDYAMICARAFGALIMMRDDPDDKPIPKQFEPDTSYYDREIAKAQATLEEVKSLDDAECTALADAEYQAAFDAYQGRLKERADQRGNYEAMIAKVHAWNTPATHAELKSFMASQLNESLEFDCNGSWDHPPELKTGAQWRHQTIDSAEQSIARHVKSRREEIERTESRNKWLSDLMSSLEETTS